MGFCHGGGEEEDGAEVDMGKEVGRGEGEGLLMIEVNMKGWSVVRDTWQPSSHA